MGIKAAAPSVLVALALMAGCQSGPSGISPAPAAPADSASAREAPAAPTSTADSSAAGARHKGLPDPNLTPGERGDNPVKRADIDPAEARKALEGYGVKPGDPRSVVCRLYPPEIGGTSNAANLFVTTPWFADLKSRLDIKLAQLVKSKQITPEQAAADLKANWVKATHKYYVRNFGEKDKAAARKKEDELRWEH